MPSIQRILAWSTLVRDQEGGSSNPLADRSNTASNLWNVRPCWLKILALCTLNAFAAPSVFSFHAKWSANKLCTLSPLKKLEAPMSFDQFEFHLCNMYFRAGRSFREPQCPSLLLSLTTLFVLTIKANVAAVGP
jgi:hypothetical protein